MKNGFCKRDGYPSPFFFLCIIESSCGGVKEGIWLLDCTVIKKATQSCIPACFKRKKHFCFDCIEIIVWYLFQPKIKKKLIFRSCQDIEEWFWLLLLLQSRMRTQSTTTCSQSLEGICVSYLCTTPSPLLCFGWTAEIVCFPSKAVVTAAWGQPALRKQNINYAGRKPVFKKP